MSKMIAVALLSLTLSDPAPKSLDDDSARLAPAPPEVCRALAGDLKGLDKDCRPVKVFVRKP